MPRDLMVFTCATRIFDAATIFMALVIFAMFCTDRMRCLTAVHTSLALGLQSWPPQPIGFLRAPGRSLAHSTVGVGALRSTPASWEA